MIAGIARCLTKGLYFAMPHGYTTARYCGRLINILLPSISIQNTVTPYTRAHE